MDSLFKQFKEGNLYDRHKDIHQYYGGFSDCDIFIKDNENIIIFSKNDREIEKDYLNQDKTFIYHGIKNVGLIAPNSALKDKNKNIFLFQQENNHIQEDSDIYKFLGRFTCINYTMFNREKGEARMIFTLEPQRETDLEKMRQAAYAAAPEEVESKKGGMTIYSRKKIIAEYVCIRAKGKCELCRHDAPFIKADGNPYLEAHHILNLASDDGIDHPKFMAAICPNCHREAHHGRQREKIKEELLKIAAIIEQK